MMRQLVRWATVGVGLLMIGLAVFADRLGLDANSAWGPSRRLLFTAGLLVMGSSWAGDLLRIARRWAGRWDDAFSVAWEASGVRRTYRRWGSDFRASILGQRLQGASIRVRAMWGAAVGRSRILRRLFGTRAARVAFAAWTAFAVVAVSYVWFVGVGHWVRWPSTSAYYDLQADAFLHGQTYLLVEPSEALLQLANPYDPDSRLSVPHLWDASLYGGRYYLYWGPVPALLMSPLKAVTGAVIGDNVAVLVFSVGALYWATRLLTRGWMDRFQNVPGWLVVGSVLTVGWANPTTWNLNSPWVYEAAIVGGQFFLMMGLYALYPLLGTESTRARDLVWAGISLALAVGTRSTLVVAVAVVSLIVLFRLLGIAKGASRAQIVRAGSSYLVPLAIGALALGIYNDVRFGSPLDLGHRYQLTSVDLMTANPNSMSMRNIPPNLYNYLVNPVRRLAVFPYIKANWGGIRMSVLRIPVPPGYYSRQIAGLLLVAPFSLFAFGVVSRLWRSLQRRRTVVDTEREDGTWNAQTNWWSGTLIAISASQFLVVMGYIVASMRYQGDFMPTLMLASIFGLWAGTVERIRWGRRLAAFYVVALLLMTWTAAAGLLLGVTSTFARFENLNPILFDRLTRFFTP